MTEGASTGSKMLHGGCHCGAVRFRVEVPTSHRQLLDCNCSICRKKGYLHLIVPAAAFTLEQGREALATYRFNTGAAQHHFCQLCGCAPFYIPRSHPDGVDINARCLEPAVPEGRFEIVRFDGAHWEDNAGSIQGGEA